MVLMQYIVIQGIEIAKQVIYFILMYSSLRFFFLKFVWFLVKGVNFYGATSSYVVSGSDCGRIFFWEKETEHIVQALNGDENGVVNVLEPHPSFPIIATSGLDSNVKIWMPLSDEYNDLKDLPKVRTFQFLKFIFFF